MHGLYWMKKKGRGAGAVQGGHDLPGHNAGFADPGKDDPAGSLVNGLDGLLEGPTQFRDQPENALGLDFQDGFSLFQDIHPTVDFQAEFGKGVVGGNGILPVEAGPAKIVFFHPGGLDHSLHTQVSQAVQLQKFLNFRYRMLAGDQFFPGGKIDPVIAGIAMGRAADPHMDLLGPGLPEGPDPRPAGGPADDGILHDHHPLPFEHDLDRVQLHPHPEIPHALGRLDEGPAHVMIADHPHLKGKPDASANPRAA